MKKNRMSYYFPVHSDMFDDTKIIKLIRNSSGAGFGLFIAVLSKMRTVNGYLITLEDVKMLKARLKVRSDVMNKVIYESELFEEIEVDGVACFRSPYLEEIMEPYDETVKRNAERGRKTALQKERDEKGRFTRDDPANKTNQNNTNDDISSSAGAAVADEKVITKKWEEVIDTAFADDEYCNVVAQSSEVPDLFMTYRHYAAQQFKAHCQAQGKTRYITSVERAKAYFSNYIRAGSPTQKRMRAALEVYHRKQAEDDPYRFEERIGGKRYSCGIPLPDDAPPRPNNRVFWSDIRKQWM